MQKTFEEFASFGAGLNAQPLLDNSKFAKLCRDSGWLDQKFNKTSVDLVWSKIMRKERKMNFQQFELALAEIAERKGVPVSELKLCAPSSNKTTAIADDDWVKKQTDVSLYTGAHKLKFDQTTGKGLGLAGRVDTGVRGLEDILDRTSADIRGRNVEILEKQAREK